MRGEKESVTGQPLLITTYMYMYMYNPPSQFSRLGMYMYICLFVRDMVWWVILLSFLSYFFKLVCYAHVFPCTCTCTCNACTYNVHTCIHFIFCTCIGV